MEERSIIHDTFVIERSYPRPPERVFAAFAETAQKRRWFAEGDHHEVVEFAMDFRERGFERLCYRFSKGTPFEGVIVTHEGSFQDILPNRRVVTASTMTLGEKRISASLVTCEFVPTDTGTDLICTHQAAYFEGADGPQIRQAGWRQLFEKLAKELAR